MHEANHHSAHAFGAVRLGDPVLDRYLEFVEARARHNTVLATASDLKAFFAIVDKVPADVTPADVLSAPSLSSESPRGMDVSSDWRTVSRVWRPGRSRGACRRCRDCSAISCCVAMRPPTPFPGVWPHEEWDRGGRLIRSPPHGLHGPRPPVGDELWLKRVRQRVPRSSSGTPDERVKDGGDELERAEGPLGYSGSAGRRESRGDDHHHLGVVADEGRGDLRVRWGCVGRSWRCA